MVVAVGDTETEPPETGVTLPTPLLIDALVALELVQLSVDEPPVGIEDGLAESVPDGGLMVTVV